MRKLLVVGVMLALAACSAKSTGSGSGQGGGLHTGGTSAAGAGSSTAGTDGFGNGTGNAGSTGTAGANANFLPDGGCPIGVQCKPNTPDPTNCGTLTLKGDVKTVMSPGNVLMVFDRSGSMAENWGNSGSKSQAAGTAMISALMPLQDQLTVGAVFFPNPTGGFGGTLSCGVDPITSMDQINFMPGAMALTKMQAAAPSGTPTPLYNNWGTGSTPTYEALQAADTALTGAAGTLKGTVVVILVTDGDPTCMWDANAATALVTKWAGMGIKTYALGMPGVGSMGETLLNQLAMAGGTGMYIPPTDSMTLQMKIHDIVQQTVSVGFDSCTIHLTPAADVPNKLNMIVTQNGMELAVPHMYPGSEAAWTVSADGKTVEILGNTCTAAKNGTYNAIRFEFSCKEIPPAPPPPVPQ